MWSLGAGFVLLLVSAVKIFAITRKGYEVDQFFGLYVNKLEYGRHLKSQKMNRLGTKNYFRQTSANFALNTEI
jgi:hypothetical protein